MLLVQQASTSRHHEDALLLFDEYLRWAAGQLKQHYGIEWDVNKTLHQDRQNLGAFAPPAGRLLIAYVNDVPTGVLSMKLHSDGAAELKRMYVRSANRNQGIGRALLDQAIEEARLDGRPMVRLDSAGFMSDAHALYRRAGFRDAAPYEESEIPVELQHRWVFMELALPRG
ncbi:MAG TPA: GNAT family N-acetyltransferase [Deinococcales bacterium]|nr:GNAT family N-acetyltransferase [Deinococcales bacterium]